MAELQWVVEVRCVNALLAEMKVGERGEHTIVNIPDRSFDPSEFDKLIEGLEVSGRIAEENRRSRKKQEIERSPASIKVELGENVEVLEERSLYNIQILKTGEVVSINVPDRLFTPSEIDQFITDLKAVKNKMEELRKKTDFDRSP